MCKASRRSRSSRTKILYDGLSKTMTDLTRAGFRYLSIETPSAPTKIRGGVSDADRIEARPAHGGAARIPDFVRAAARPDQQPPKTLRARRRWISISGKMARRAAAIRQMTRCEGRRVEMVRRSGRTGQTHSIGGFVGVAEYEGPLAEFMPYLEGRPMDRSGTSIGLGQGVNFQSIRPANNPSPSG